MSRHILISSPRAAEILGGVKPYDAKVGAGACAWACVFACGCDWPLLMVDVMGSGQYPDDVWAMPR
jgi:hypothetical protein